MTLWADMLPDPSWTKRGRVERDGQGLSVTRANVLHASASLRISLLWAIVFTTYALSSDFEDVSTPIHWFLGGVAVLAFVCAIWSSMCDFSRTVDIAEKLRPELAHSRHLLEVIAIPLLVFATALLFFWCSLWPFILEVQSQNGPQS
jgi:hypothetical protein